MFAIEFYTKINGVKYPIFQSLHTSLPDFYQLAMENWGLVTYREVYLVLSKNSPFASRQQIALLLWPMNWLTNGLGTS